MKSILLPALLALASIAMAAEPKLTPPNGGRLIKSVTPMLELLITPERTVEIRALTPDGKPTKLGTQTVTINAGERSAPTRLTFTERDGRLVSSGALPPGTDYPVSVAIKSDAAAKTIYERFNLNLSKCPSCRFLEYACVCDH